MIIKSGTVNVTITFGDSESNYYFRTIKLGDSERYLLTQQPLPYLDSIYRQLPDRVQQQSLQ
jgi:hypothetical protein